MGWLGGGKAWSEGGDCWLGGASTEPRDPGLGRRGWLGGLGRRGRMLVGWREYGASRSRAWSEGWLGGAWSDGLVGRGRLLVEWREYRASRSRAWSEGWLGGEECLLSGASTEPRDTRLGRRAGWEGAMACWVARVQSLAIPGLVGGLVGRERMLVGWRECEASRSRAWSEGGRLR